MNQPYALYSEFDPFAAAWLRNLIEAGAIMPGLVDERDLWDLTAYDCRGFTQLHLCAGIGVWSHAARSAGWSDTRRLVSASFPCQPFSAAGKGLGFADERHLWPAGNHLFAALRDDGWWADSPVVIVGEQVASKDGLAWLDVVQADMEAAGHAFGAIDLCAAGFGAPHIRQRTYWMAYADGRDAGTERQQCGGEQRLFSQSRRASSVADDFGHGLQGGTKPVLCGAGRRVEGDAAGRCGSSLAVGVDHHERNRRDTGGNDNSEHDRQQPNAAGVTHITPAGPINGAWRDADWLYCRDERWRPVESGTFPLVNGATNRVGLLRGYGNALAAPVAQGFIETVMECVS